MTTTRAAKTVYPVVEDTLKNLTKGRDAKRYETRERNRRSVWATYNVMTAAAQRAFLARLESAGLTPTWNRLLNEVSQ